MSNTITLEHFTSNLFDLLDEAFESHHGIFLDKGTSLFETLENITAQEASIPVGGKCASSSKRPIPGSWGCCAAWKIGTVKM
jgi:hypothetical protein